MRSIPEKQLTEAAGAAGVQNHYKIGQQLASTLSDESRAVALNRALRDAAKQAPQGSALSAMFLSTGTGVMGGAGIGAVNAKLRGQDTLAGAAEGAAYGGGAGFVAGIPIVAIRFMYSHPQFGVAVLNAASKGAPLASQAAKVTHVFNPDTNRLEEVQ